MTMTTPSLLITKKCLQIVKTGYQKLRLSLLDDLLPSLTRTSFMNDTVLLIGGNVPTLFLYRNYFQQSTDLIPRFQLRYERTQLNGKFLETTLKKTMWERTLRGRGNAMLTFVAKNKVNDRRANNSIRTA